MLYLIGLGLSDEKDVTVRGLEAIKASERIYLEAYTSILGVGKDRLVRLCVLLLALTPLSTPQLILRLIRWNEQEAFYGKEIIVADRDMVETESDDILANADKVDVSFLVVGDPFGYVCSLLLHSLLTGSPRLPLPPPQLPRNAEQPPTLTSSFEPTLSQFLTP